MYRNIGGKIKGLAIATFILECIAAIIAAIVLLSEEIWWGALISIYCGPIVALFSSWLLYGFGEIIDKLCDIEQNTRGGQSKTKIKETTERTRKEAKEKAKKEAEDISRKKAEEIAKKEAQAAAEETKKRAAEAIKYQAIEKELASIEYIDVVCSNCHERLSFEKGTSEAQCPFCDCKLNID